MWGGVGGVVSWLGCYSAAFDSMDVRAAFPGECTEVSWPWVATCWCRSWRMEGCWGLGWVEPSSWGGTVRTPGGGGADGGSFKGKVQLVEIKSCEIDMK